ncbi:MAG TPA: BON domain-containing protein [Ktedonobacterales bacterium]
MVTSATTFTPVHKFRFGAVARDAEGATASLANVVVDAASRTVTAVGLRFGAFGRVVYAPATSVNEASESQVTVDLTREQIEKDGKQPVGVLLSGSIAVSLNGKRQGKLSQISINADTQTLRHLIVERGMGESVVSAAAIQQINANGITLGAPSDGSAALTPFHPDEELRRDALKALDSYNRLRVDVKGINVTAIDGVLWLRGHVSSELNRRLAQDLVSGLYGLAELHNELITDPELAAAISHALAGDPRTAEDRIGVYSMLGAVHLRGAVRTAAAREAAGQLANQVLGVGEVYNDLVVNPDANVLPVMAGVTGSEDVVPGGR